MPVRILDEQVVNRIAAGEVVERPASMVKELVENALDAGASQLQVHLRAGGKGMVRVVDNGSGMNRTDAVMSLERHATSKIRSDADLFKVSSLGFRGEAIPSIASITRFEMLTRPADQEEGTRIFLEGGVLRAVESAGCAPGTDIRASSIFFNVPARRKFLRSNETELSHCLEAITREALIRPGLDLEVTHDDRELVRCLSGGDRRQRAAALLGEHGAALVPVHFRRGSIEVEALVSPVGVHRSSSTGSSYLYVNGRFVRDQLLRRALSSAYAAIVPKDRYPLVVLELRIPPSEVDVNVHPAKTEVRFVHALAVQEALTAGLREALAAEGIHRPVSSEARYRPMEDRSEFLFDVRSPEETGAAIAPTDAELEEVFRAEQEEDGRRELLQAELESRGEGRAQVDSREALDAAEVQQTGDSASIDEVESRVGLDTAEAAEPMGAEPTFAPVRAPVPPTRRVEALSGEPASPPPTFLAGPTTEAQVISRGGLDGGKAPSPARPTEALDRTPVVQRLPALPPGLPQRTKAPVLERRGPLLPVRRYADLRIIGQLANTYILCEGGGELLIVDQHAAHERVNLVRLERQQKDALGPSQRLLTPVMVELPPARARVLSQGMEGLSRYGLELSFMGGGSFAIHAIPPALQREDLATLLADAADDVLAGGPGRSPEERVQRVLATMACHASVRAGQPLSLPEMEELLRALDVVDFGVCAHGRPVVVRLDVAELERRFHRT